MCDRTEEKNRGLASLYKQSVALITVRVQPVTALRWRILAENLCVALFESVTWLK
jgi:hypothetical protein